MARGEHIKVWRSFYWHHGIDLGDGTVVHLSGEPGRRLDAAVRLNSLDDFLRGGEQRVVQHRESLAPEETIERALSCLGQVGYSIIWRNCEHFARWCAVDRHESAQVRDAINGAVVLGLAGSVVAAVARHRGLMVLSRAVPVLAPLSAGLLVAGALSSLLGGFYGSPFDSASDS